MKSGTGRFVPRVLRAAAVACVTSAASLPAVGADVSSSWLGGTGDWHDATMWNPAVVPNNGSQTFDVTLPAGTTNLTVNPTIQRLNITGGALISPQATPFTVTANELFTWAGGRINNTTILANGGAVLNPGGVGSQFRITVPSGQTLTTNGGSIDMTRSVVNNNGSMQVNASTRFTTNPNNVTFWTGSFNNAGVINLNNTLTFDNVAFNNTGVVNSNSGGVTMHRGGVWTGGRFVTANPGSASVIFTEGEAFLDANSHIPGNVLLGAGGGGGTATFDFPMTRTTLTSVGNSQFFNGGAIFNAPVTFDGPLTVDGSLIANAGGQVNVPFTLRRRIGGVTINAPATFTSGSVGAVSIGGGLIHGIMTTTNNAPIALETGLIVDAGTFNNHGPITASSTRTISGAGLINNTSTITTGAGTMLLSGPSLRNGGTVSGGALRVEGGSVLVNDGTVTGDSMRLTGTLRNNSGGSLTLAGGTGLLTQLGRLATGAAGSTGPSAGHFDLDGNVFTSENAAGANPFLEVHLGGTAQGTQYDWFDVSGSAVMAGRLEVSFLGTFYEDVTAADTFTIVTSGGPMSGGFSNLFMGNRVVTTDARGSFAVTFTSNGVVLGDFSTVIPEPGAAVCLTTSVTLAAIARRRRRVAR